MQLMRARQWGFTLIELMVSMVLSLLVAAAVVALVVAVVRSNRQTLQSTRLNQELRATLDLVAKDMRRARSVRDPLTTAMALNGNPYRNILTPANTCAIYAYDDAASGPWHVVRVDNGRVVLEGAATAPTSCTPGGTAIPLGSQQIRITDIRFDRQPSAAPDDFVREIDVSITGRLVDTNPDAPIVERTMSQTVYVRSVGTGI